MSRLQRYLLSELLVPFGVWLLFLFLLLFVMQFLRGTDVLLGSAVTARDIARLTFFLLPHFLVMAVPIAFLLAILLGFGRLSEDRELIAMQSLGVSPLQFLVVPLGLAATLTAVMLLLFAGVEPWGTRMLKSVANEVIKRNVVADVKPGLFYDDISQLTLYAERVDRPRNRWERVLIHDDRDPSRPFLVLAREAEVDATSGDALRLRLSGGQVHRAGRETDEYAVVDFERGEINVGLEEELSTKGRRFQAPGGKEGASLVQLVESAKDASAHGEDATPFWMAFHWRLGQAFSLVAFALFGLPLAMTGRAGSRARGFLFTLLGYVGYHVLSRSFENWGLEHRLPTGVAGQAVNVLFATAGLVALSRLAGWRRNPSQRST